MRVPTLIIDVEQEELVNRLEHGFAAYETIRHNAICEYKLLQGTHYNIYDRLFGTARDMALDWFQTHLTVPSHEPVSVQV